MGRLVIVLRLAVRDLRRRRSEALLLLLAMTAATATLTLGLVLHGVTDQPYQNTRAATHGPDITAEAATTNEGTTSPADLDALRALITQPYVRAHSGPYPMTTTVLRAGALTAGADVEGRDPGPAAVDQPKVTSGSWIQPGGVVVERTFADAANLHLGQTITLNRQPFKVVGFAVTTAFSTYPTIGCQSNCSFGSIQLDASDTGLMWTTQADARSLATTNAPFVYFLNLSLHDSAQAQDIADSVDGGFFGHTVVSPGGPPATTTPSLDPWQQISRRDANLVRNEQTVLLVGSWLLAILALASVAVLVGGRMADQIRRVGLLKAIGGTPGFVAAVLMAEYVAVALISAVLGIVLGRVFAPVLTSPGNGLLGSAPAPPLTVTSVLVVLAVALGVALVASMVPALRAAQTITVRALADSARRPKRSPFMVSLSRLLPVSLMISFRIMGRRIRRTALSALSIFVTVSGIVALLIAHAKLAHSQGAKGIGFAGSDLLINPRTQAADRVLLIVTLMLVAMAAVNAIFVTRAIAQDARHASAITRALGATPGHVTAGLAGAQVLPALVGAFLGIPGGYALYNVAKHGGDPATLPPVVDLILVLVCAAVAVAALTSIPARWAARRPVATILQSELA